MTDINQALVEYLIEDHRRLANRDLPATIKALTEEVERWRASNQRLTKDLNQARGAAPTEVARWVNAAFELWDEDPDKAFRALSRAHQALNQQEAAS